MYAMHSFIKLEFYFTIVNLSSNKANMNTNNYST